MVDVGYEQVRVLLLDFSQVIQIVLDLRSDGVVFSPVPAVEESKISLEGFSSLHVFNQKISYKGIRVGLQGILQELKKKIKKKPFNISSCLGRTLNTS